MIPNNGRLDLTDNEMKTLASFCFLANRAQKAKYLEIGVYAGGTIKFIKDQVKNIECVGIDLFEDFCPNDENTHVSGNYKLDEVSEFLGTEIKLIKGNSSIILQKLYEENQGFDVIFIDGNHKYDAVKSDFENSMKILNTNGFIALHNASTCYFPDYDLYNKIDGGPWLLATQIKLTNKKLICVAEVDRLCIFGAV